jgi:hypothetical protein
MCFVQCRKPGRRKVLGKLPFAAPHNRTPSPAIRLLRARLGWRGAKEDHSGRWRERGGGPIPANAGPWGRPESERPEADAAGGEDPLTPCAAGTGGPRKTRAAAGGSAEEAPSRRTPGHGVVRRASDQRRTRGGRSAYSVRGWDGGGPRKTIAAAGGSAEEAPYRRTPGHGVVRRASDQRRARQGGQPPPWRSGFGLALKTSPFLAFLALATRGASMLCHLPVKRIEV